jgi:hypothetical protein
MSFVHDVEHFCDEHDITAHVDVNLGIFNIGVEGKL